MLDFKNITQQILQKQWFSEEEITKNLFDDLFETIQEYYTTAIFEELPQTEKANFLLLIKQQLYPELERFLEKYIYKYEQFIIDLTIQLTKQMGIKNLEI